MLLLLFNQLLALRVTVGTLKLLLLLPFVVIAVVGASVVAVAAAIVIAV